LSSIKTKTEAFSGRKKNYFSHAGRIKLSKKLI